jgi:hypothetical protein
MIMVMAGQLPRVLLQLVLRFLLVHGCLYVIFFLSHDIDISWYSGE